jgi:hypothetical protein
MAISVFALIGVITIIAFIIKTVCTVYETKKEFNYWKEECRELRHEFYEFRRQVERD